MCSVVKEDVLQLIQVGVCGKMRTYSMKRRCVCVSQSTDIQLRRKPGSVKCPQEYSQKVNSEDV